MPSAPSPPGCQRCLLPPALRSSSSRLAAASAAPVLGFGSARPGPAQQRGSVMAPHGAARHRPLGRAAPQGSAPAPSPLSLGCGCFSMYLRAISSIFSSFGGPWSQAVSYVPPPPPGRHPPPLVPLSSALPPAPRSLRYRGEAPASSEEPARHLKRIKQGNIRQKGVHFYLGLRRFPLVWSYAH